jgi:hypothetical protein
MELLDQQPLDYLIYMRDMLAQIVCAKDPEGSIVSHFNSYDGQRIEFDKPCSDVQVLVDEAIDRASKPMF